MTSLFLCLGPILQYMYMTSEIKCFWFIIIEFCNISFTFEKILKFERVKTACSATLKETYYFHLLSDFSKYLAVTFCPLTSPIVNQSVKFKYKLFCKHEK